MALKYRNTQKYRNKNSWRGILAATVFYFTATLGRSGNTPTMEVAGNSPVLFSVEE